MEKITVELCMGSSCFARGNSKALANIEAFIAENHLEDRVELVGHLCLANCSKGPNVRIGAVQYPGLKPECLVDLVSGLLDQEHGHVS